MKDKKQFIQTALYSTNKKNRTKLEKRILILIEHSKWHIKPLSWFICSRKEYMLAWTEFCVYVFESSEHYYSGGLQNGMGQNMLYSRVHL